MCGPNFELWACLDAPFKVWKAFQQVNTSSDKKYFREALHLNHDQHSFNTLLIRGEIWCIQVLISFKNYVTLNGSVFPMQFRLHKIDW